MTQEQVNCYTVPCAAYLQPCNHPPNHLFKCKPYTYIMQILSSKMTQLDGWDAACFNKARAGNDNYEDSDELSKR
jgi:hypothetical protein